MALLAINIASGAVTWLVSATAQAYILGGIVQFALRVARGDRPDFGVVFSGGRFFVPLLGATLLYSLGVALGFAFCIVPGLFLAGLLGGILGIRRGQRHGLPSPRCQRAGKRRRLIE